MCAQRHLIGFVQSYGFSPDLARYADRREEILGTTVLGSRAMLLAVAVVAGSGNRLLLPSDARPPAHGCRWAMGMPAHE